MLETSLPAQKSVCPHDCPSTCALLVDRDEEGQVKRLRGNPANAYTDGVICAKVARYKERIHHPDRLTKALRRTGPKGAGLYEEIDVEEALDIVAARFKEQAALHGSETVWPYFYAGTMGYVMRDGIERLRHLMGYSGQYQTLCTTIAKAGYEAGTGVRRGIDAREMADSDVIVIWGTNPVHTQVNVMTHAVKARKNRGAKIITVDVYETPTIKQSDLGIILRPGTDGALAVAIMHILFRDGLVDRDYLENRTDCDSGFEDHLRHKTPDWAAAITGVDVAQIEEMAALIGAHKNTFFRLGYGFTRTRNGAVNMHAALSIPAVTGAWAVKGGGALHSSSGMYPLNLDFITAAKQKRSDIRELDMAQIGRVLCGDPDVIKDGPPVTAMIIQNTNPMMVAPDLGQVQKGFSRDDLFVCVHEQFMTDTAKMADIILPATMFLEHDDFYTGSGHTNLLFGPKIMDAPGDCLTNLEVITGLSKRLGIDHPANHMSAREITERILAESGIAPLADWEDEGWVDCTLSFEDNHFLNGFDHADGRYHFKPNWEDVSDQVFGPGDASNMPIYPDFWDARDPLDDEKQYRLVTAPARNFLNSSFSETPTSRSQEKYPEIFMAHHDAKDLGLDEGSLVFMGNEQGSLRLRMSVKDGLIPGVVVVESIWPNDAFEGGLGINLLTRALPGSPKGGVVYHDTAVWIKPVKKNQKA